MHRQALISFGIVLAALLFGQAATAQIGDNPGDHTAHQASELISNETSAASAGAEDGQPVDHETMDHEAMTDDSMDQESMNHENMDHEAAGPSDRSPHAYSDGFERERGPYALPPSQQVRLADEQSFRRLLFNRLESLDKQHRDAGRFDVQVWYGPTYDHIVLKTEGEVHGGSIQESRSELLWSHAISRFWDAQYGMRFDTGDGPSRNWLAAGVQGLAPYWFDVHATAFLGESGRTAIGLEGEYEVRLTQRLILKPRVDLNFYGDADKELGIGSGLSNATVGIRLQYQIDRQFAPYFGVEREAKFGETAEFTRSLFKENTRETRWVAGIRIWY